MNLVENLVKHIFHWFSWYISHVNDVFFVNEPKKLLTPKSSWNQLSSREPNVEISTTFQGSRKNIVRFFNTNRIFFHGFGQFFSGFNMKREKNTSLRLPPKKKPNQKAKHQHGSKTFHGKRGILPGNPMNVTGTRHQEGRQDRVWDLLGLLRIY